MNGLPPTSGTGLVEPGPGRDETAAERDQAAQQRDALAAGRDREADLADQRGLERDDNDAASALKPTRQVQELHARALADHKRAAEDRVSAKQDREFGERDREEAKRDRERAPADERSLALARRTIVDLAQQRAHLIGAQTVGQFGTWEWDIATDVTSWTAELYRIYGRDPSAAAMSFDEYVACVHADDRSAVRAVVQAAFETGECFSFEHRIVRPDGLVRVLHSRGGVLMGPDGAPATMRGTAQDITERCEVERAKDEFISIVSHELRTPLTSIRGALGLLAGGVLGPLPEKGQRMVEIAVQNTDRLVRLINDILDIERIDSGTVDMHPQPCDGAELIKGAIQCVEQFAADAHVFLIGEGAPVTVYADPDRVHQMLTNLICNAVKFSPHGSTVRVSCASRDGEALFEVADDGKGIPADRLASIFERFGQVDASDSREKGGTGLGLAICRKIVEHHNGRIWVESELTVGSSFFVALPILAPDSPTARAAETA